MNNILTEADICYWNIAEHLYNNDNTNCHWVKLFNHKINCGECTYYMPRFVGYLKDCPIALDIDNINARHLEVKRC